METVKLVKIYRTNKGKDGKPLMGKNGKPYTRTAIQTREYGASWLSGFENRENAEWQEGDEVDVTVTHVTGNDGKEYLNFAMPNIWDVVKGLEKRIIDLENAGLKKVVIKADATVPEDLPF